MKIIRDYQGRDVRLTDERLRHILRRAEMTDSVEAIEQTLRNPQFVIESPSEPDVQLNYRFYLGTRIGDKWLCVVVRYSVSDAFVATAYLTNRVKKGRQLWPNQ